MIINITLTIMTLIAIIMIPKKIKSYKTMSHNTLVKIATEYTIITGFMVIVLLIQIWIG